jgi:glycosyltransferase involved in cell wall biosynthesis
VALFSKAFLPHVGGIETSSAMLAEIWSRDGHEVEVVTATPDDAPPVRPYRVTRQWSAATLRRACLGADVVVSNGYSRMGIVVARLAGKRPVVLHQGYQFICTDGLGFRGQTFHGFDPLRDLQLAFAHSAREGLRGIGKKGFDAAVRRWPGCISHVVPSKHVARRLELRDFDILYQPPNPIVMGALAREGEVPPSVREAAYRSGDVMFFGRLVFEKGVEDLLQGFASFRARWASIAPRSRGGRTAPPRLMIHGEGPDKERLVRLAQEIGIAPEVDFRGFLSGDRLVAAARGASLVVVPSRWEEPGATIAVELFACGASVLASEAGAPGEIFREHGRLFRNGDAADLAAQLEAHIVEGPRYPRPTGTEPWTMPAIVEMAQGIVRRAGASARPSG